MEKIFEQIDDIVFRETQAICREYAALFLETNGEVISKELERRLKHGVFEQRDFGVEVIKVQVRFTLPEKLREKMVETIIERQERKTELLEYETIAIAATELHKQSIKRGGTMTYDQCVKEIKNLRLIKDGKVTRIESDGNSLTLNEVVIGGGKSGK